MSGENRKRKSCVYRNFKGVDYAHAPANVASERCVNGLNMVRSEAGKVHKRTGYYFEERVWMGNINGVHFYNKTGGTERLVHCGDSIYIDGVNVYSGMADRKSRSIQTADRLFILDGEHFLVYNGNSIAPVKDNCYIPVVYINRKPEGGGRKNEQVNMLTSKRREGFISDGTAEYVLSRAALDADSVTAVVYRDDGTVQNLTEGNGITVDRAKGTVKFSAAPAATKYTDTSNVYITYSKSGGGDGNILEKCTVMGLFGAGGKPDTLFLSGHPDYPGREWFSARNNPFFFGKSNTDSAGSVPVTGYSVRGDKLFVHRRGAGNNLNILVRSCSGGDENFFSYPVVNMLAGPGTIAPDSFVNMAADSLFLTEKGVYAIAESEADERHFAQSRSYYINPSLMACSGLEEAGAVEHGDFYVLAVGRDIYLLDTLQKSYEEDVDYTKRQYECYHWQISEKIRLLFVEDGQLCFADDRGRIGRFYSDYSRPESFNDNGRAINAVWQTGDFTAGLPGRNKNIHRISVVCAVALRTGVAVYVQIKGLWHRLFEDSSTARFFRWSALCWSKFTWSADQTPKIISRNIRLKNIDKTAIRLENGSLNEPFGIYEISFEYTEGSYYR